MEELYNKIEDYLAGNLSAEDRAAFEQTLQEDPGLLAELALHRRLQETFSDPQEVALRQSLREIRDTFSEAPSEPVGSKPFYQNIWFYIGLIAILLVIYLVTRSQNATSDLPDSPTQDTIIQEQNTDANTLPQVDTAATQVPETSNVEKAPSTPTVPTRPPIASRDPFATNPALEVLLDHESQSNRYSFELNANVVALDQGSNVIIDGELVSTALEDEQFSIVIFDNNPANFPTEPLMRQVLRVRETQGERTFAFGAKKRYAILFDEIIEALTPGLYYYQIYLEGKAEPLYTGTFRKES